MPSATRRVVTGKDAAGKAVAMIDGVAANVRERKETGIAATLLWVTDSTPAGFSHDADAAARNIGVHPPANGTIFRVVEFAPAKDVHSDYKTRLRIMRRWVSRRKDQRVRTGAIPECTRPTVWITR